MASSGRLRFLLVEAVDVFDAARFASDAAALLRDREDDAFRILAVPFGGGTMRSYCAAGTLSYVVMLLASMLLPPSVLDGPANACVSDDSDRGAICVVAGTLA